MQTGLVSLAVAAVTSLAETLDLHVNEAVVIQNSNTLALRLLPCNSFVRIALVGQEVAALEVKVAQGLAALNGPVATLDGRVEPRRYEVDGFAATFWTYYETVLDRDSPSEYADTLHRLHAAMRSLSIPAPSFTERTAEAERLVAHHDQTPALVERDRNLLLSTLHGAGKQFGAE